ncbi:hypothetical protein NH340_JMT06641 [Sarcoptes scabiei]|nr:hypothetical protein NH340_JMT06641 [Sarcoptes scabiei]
MTEISRKSGDSDGEKPELLGLNVHKAGLSGFDKEKINQIIQEASKGSNFYLFQEKKQRRIEDQINKLKSKLEKFSMMEKLEASKKADELIELLEQNRVLNRIIVHFDMDMFFAAVEIKNDPSLKDKPMAVGSLSMIATSNYVARKYGVRSAMAGFIAKKLCPELILIKPDFRKYSAESEIVMNILREYDHDLRNWSLDEVAIDLTSYVLTHYALEKRLDLEILSSDMKLNDEIWQLAYEIVESIRSRVKKETKLTVSAGISCNTRLAKVCTDINKPDGQFMIKGDRDEIMEFVSKTSIRKFSGIGPVREQILSAFEIHKAQDIYTNRAALVLLFSEINYLFYFKIYLGIGSTYLGNLDDSPESNAPQKSYSREKTFTQTNNFEDLCQSLRKICTKLANDLISDDQECRTVTLKLKKSSFEIFIRARTIDRFTNDPDVLYDVGKELLRQEIDKQPMEKYRLLGMKASNLQNENLSRDNNTNNQSTLSQYFKSSNTKNSDQTGQEIGHEIVDDNSSSSKTNPTLGPMSEPNDFETIATKKSNEIMKVSGEESFDSLQLNTINRSPQRIEKINSKTIERRDYEDDDGSQFLQCPICQMKTLFSNNDDLNRHIDLCLNRKVCIELTTVPPPTIVLNTSSSTKSASTSLSSPSESTSINNESIVDVFERISPSKTKRSLRKDRRNHKMRKNSETIKQTRIDHYFQN